MRNFKTSLKVVLFKKHILNVKVWSNPTVTKACFPSLFGAFILVMQRFRVVYREISHDSLFFSRYTHELTFRRLCIPRKYIWQVRYSLYNYESALHHKDSYSSAISNSEGNENKQRLQTLPIDNAWSKKDLIFTWRFVCYNMHFRRDCFN